MRATKDEARRDARLRKMREHWHARRRRFADAGLTSRGTPRIYAERMPVVHQPAISIITPPGEFSAIELAKRSIARGWMRPAPVIPKRRGLSPKARRARQTESQRKRRAQLMQAGLRHDGVPRKRQYRRYPELAGLSAKARRRVYHHCWYLRSLERRDL